MSDRVKKVNEFLRQEVARGLEMLDFRELVTVKAVETSRDLKHADIWIGILGDEESAMDKIMKNQRNLQFAVNRKMPTKNVPKLRFRIDHSGEHALKIEELLKGEKG